MPPSLRIDVIPIDPSRDAFVWRVVEEVYVNTRADDRVLAAGQEKFQEDAFLAASVARESWAIALDNRRWAG